MNYSSGSPNKTSYSNKNNTCMLLISFRNIITYSNIYEKEKERKEKNKIRKIFKVWADHWLFAGYRTGTETKRWVTKTSAPAVYKHCTGQTGN